jgi:transcriptional regulator GlxA family with amidase domain
VADPGTDHGLVRTRRVVVVVFPGVQGVDVFGPVDVFSFANYVIGLTGEPVPPYEVELAGPEAGPTRTSAGPSLVADRSVNDPGLVPDVLLVAGGLAVEAAADDDGFVTALAALAARTDEVGSVCTGALLLAEAGLLSGRVATTHWALAEGLAARHPDVDVDPDRIFAFDGVWSSAGITAGIDLALQIVRTHHGSAVAADVARYMVVYLQRSGGQQQFSTHLAAQSSANPTVADVMAHIADHPDADLSISALATLVSMSERSFQRLFTSEVGISPGRYVERTRIDAARARLEQTDDGLSAIAKQCGFTSAATFLRSFRRVVGVSPTEYRQRFPTRPGATADQG